jgi:hypothetical protein
MPVTQTRLPPPFPANACALFSSSGPVRRKLILAAEPSTVNFNLFAISCICAPALLSLPQIHDARQFRGHAFGSGVRRKTHGDIRRKARAQIDPRFESCASEAHSPPRNKAAIRSLDTISAASMITQKFVCGLHFSRASQLWSRTPAQAAATAQIDCGRALRRSTARLHRKWSRHRRAPTPCPSGLHSGPADDRPGKNCKIAAWRPSG